MQITITAQTITTAAAVLAALTAIIVFIAKLVRWTDRQQAQDAEISSIKDELTLLTYGLLACLKGLKEQGCDGPVTEAITKIEKHMNIKAHE